jgi:hypothetical protein
MSKTFSEKELEESLLSIGKTLKKVLSIEEEDLTGLEPEDLDRDATKKRNEEAIKVAISMNDTYVLTACAARIAEETRAVRDINIANATRKQLLLSRLNIIYDKYRYLKARLEQLKQRNQQNE